LLELAYVPVDGRDAARYPDSKLKENSELLALIRGADDKSGDLEAKLDFARGEGAFSSTGKSASYNCVQTEYRNP
jgi:hypothetical protein